MESFGADQRRAQSLSPLTFSEGLTAGAQIRAEEIKSLGNVGLLVDHTRPDGSDFSTVLDDKYSHFAENLDGGARSPEQVVEEWMGSAAHRQNILNGAYKKIRAAHVNDDSDPSDLRFYWTQLFADRLNTLETIDAAEIFSARAETSTVSKIFLLGDGDENFFNDDYGVTIAALGGNNSIANDGLIVSIVSGAGNDSIQNSGSFATINTGGGNDSIQLSSDAKEIFLEYAAGDGSDTISGLNESDTVSISGSEYTPALVGNDVVLAVGSDSITLKDASKFGAQVSGDRSKLFILTDGNDSLENILDHATVLAFGGDDYLENHGSLVTLDAGTGDDEIFNGSLGSASSLFGGAGNDQILNYAHDSFINGDDGNDFIYNEGGDHSTLRGGAGDDFIANEGSNVSINSSDGKDFIQNIGENISILGGAGNDSIFSNGSNVSIDAGTDDDEIYLANDSENNFIQYTPGDGNDTYSTVVSGDDSVVKVGEGSITLVDARNKPAHIIIGDSGSSGGGSGGGNGSSSSGNGNIRDNDRREENSSSTTTATPSPAPMTKMSNQISSATFVDGDDGKDIFYGGKAQGSDTFLNVSAEDEVYLTGVTFNDLLDVEKRDDVITFSLRSGEVINIQSSDTLSGAVILDDSIWHFKHSAQP